jgi:hypothetical protein
MPSPLFHKVRLLLITLVILTAIVQFRDHLVRQAAAVSSSGSAQTCNLIATLSASATKICPPAPFSPGSPVTLQATANGGTGPFIFVWEIPGFPAPLFPPPPVDTNISTRTSAPFNLPGTYKVTVTDSRGCTATASIVVETIPAPSFEIITPTSVCAGSTGNKASVTNVAGATSYSWFISPGTVIDGQGTSQITWTAPPPLVAPGGGLIPVPVLLQVTVTANGCSTFKSVSVQTTPANIPVITGPNNFCPGQSVTLDAGAGFTSYLWSPGGQTTRTITVTPSAETTFTVMTINEAGCKFSASKTVSPQSFTIASGSRILCSGDTIFLSASGTSEDSFFWTGPGGFTSTLQFPRIQNATPAASGTYTVVRTVKGCASVPASTKVTVSPSMSVSLSRPTDCSTKIPLTPAISGGTAPFTYRWETPTGPTVGQTVNSAASGTYRVTVTDAAGCTATASTTVSNCGGSILIYPLYSSNTVNSAENTLITLTNTNSTTGVYIRLFFVDGKTCGIKDSSVCLSRSQTFRFTSSEYDPDTTGYLIAIATNADGCPINFNFLAGSEYVRLSTGHSANLNAESISAVSQGFEGTDTSGAITQVMFFCSPSTSFARLSFDGINYERLPQTLALDSVSNLSDSDTLLVLDSIEGDLRANLNSIGAVFGLIYDDVERQLSFSYRSERCQEVLRISDSFPSTAPRFSSFITRTGWIKLWSTALPVRPLIGAVLRKPKVAGGYAGGHNLHKLTYRQQSAFLSISVYPLDCL